MKNYLLIFFVLITTNFFSQNICCEDTSYLKIPVWVGKEILLDINELDRLKKLEIESNKEINQLEKKILLQEKSISVLEETNNNHLRIVGLTEEKINLLNEENKELRNDIGKIKTKHTIIEIFGGAIIGVLTYILVFK